MSKRARVAATDLALLILIAGGCAGSEVGVADATRSGPDAGSTNRPDRGAGARSDGVPSDAPRPGGGLDGGDPEAGFQPDGVPTTANLFLNPFSRLSAHHRPVGKGAIYGIPGSASAPVPGSRGRLDIVTLFRCGATEAGRKYIYRVDPGDPKRAIMQNKDSKNGSKLPYTLRIPNAKLPVKGEDKNVILCFRNGGPAPLCDLFYGFDNVADTARYRREFLLSGTDVGDGLDGQDSGGGASRVRWPGTVLRGHEINNAATALVQHALNCTATRHSHPDNKVAPKAPASRHVLNRDFVWPSSGTDGGAAYPDNQGDIPYGTRLVIRWQDRLLRDSPKLGLTARGKALFDALLYYGVYILDGQGSYDAANNGAVLQLRVDQDVQNVTELDAQLTKILPLLWPVMNPRPRGKKETEVWTDGLPYAGGGGPLDPVMSVNTAWDA